MANTGWLVATSAFSTSAGGARAWTNATQACTSDNTYALASRMSGAANPNWLLAIFDLSSVPSGAVIEGFEVRYEASRASTAWTNAGTQIQLVSGSNLTFQLLGTKTTVADTWGTTDTYVTAGGSSTFFGYTVVSAGPIKTGKFGFALRPVVSAATLSSAAAKVDAMELRVYYNVPSVSPASLEFFTDIYTQEVDSGWFARTPRTKNYGAYYMEYVSADGGVYISADKPGYLLSGENTLALDGVFAHVTALGSADGFGTNVSSNIPAMFVSGFNFNITTSAFNIKQTFQIVYKQLGGGFWHNAFSPNATARAQPFWVGGDVRTSGYGVSAATPRWVIKGVEVPNVYSPYEPLWAGDGSPLQVRISASVTAGTLFALVCSNVAVTASATFTSALLVSGGPWGASGTTEPGQQVLSASRLTPSIVNDPWWGMRSTRVWSSANAVTQQVLYYDVVRSKVKYDVNMPVQLSLGGATVYAPDINSSEYDHEIKLAAVTQLHNVGVQSSEYGHEIKLAAVTQLHSVAPASSEYEHEIKSVSLVHNVIFTSETSRSEYEHEIQSAAITQLHSVAPESSEYEDEIDSVNITFNINAQSSEYEHEIDSVGISVFANLITTDVDSAEYEDEIDSAALTQLHSVAPESSEYEDEIDSAALTQEHNVYPASSEYEDELDSAAIARQYNVSPESSEYEDEIDSVAIVRQYNVAPESSEYEDEIDSVGVVEGHTASVDSSEYGDEVDSAALTQEYNVSPQSSEYGDEIGVAGVLLVLSVQSSEYEDEIDSIGISLNFGVQSGEYDHEVENVSLTQQHNVAVLLGGEYGTEVSNTSLTQVHNIGMNNSSAEYEYEISSIYLRHFISKRTPPDRTRTKRDIFTYGGFGN